MKDSDESCELEGCCFKAQVAFQRAYGEVLLCWSCASALAAHWKEVEFIEEGNPE